MKQVLTLVLFVLCTLVNGNSTLHASNHIDVAASSSSFHIGQSFNISNPDALCNIKSSTNGEQADDVIAIQEDDDQDELTKAISAARVFVAFYYCFFFGDRYATLANCPPAYKPLNYLSDAKFIAQRVLRI